MCEASQQPPSGGDLHRNQEDGSALVPRPPGALEKPKPISNRILSGMVADTLSLARTVHSDNRICAVLVGDDPDGVIPNLCEILPKMEEFAHYSFRPINFKSSSELLAKAQSQKFDIVVINLTRVTWNIPHNGVDVFDDLVRFLALLRSAHNKPIIVFSTLSEPRLSSERFARVGVSYFEMPSSVDIFKSAFQVLLSSAEAPNDSEPQSLRADAQARSTRQLRIILLDDDADLLDLYRDIIQVSFKNVEATTFMDANAALEELSTAAPALFITGLNMPKIDGLQVLSILAGMKVEFPVMMLTAVVDADVVKRAHKIADPHFDFTYFNKPGAGEEIRKFILAVSKLIGVEPESTFLTSPGQATPPEKSAPASPPRYSAELEDWCKRGEKHYYGQGVPKDYAEAVEWFRKAAEGGHPRAQYWLGTFYERARAVPQDYRKAMRWFRKSAEQGFPSAQNALGAGYQTGLGVQQNLAQAASWYRRAAEQGDDYGQYNLGVCYRDGLGLPEDITEAAKWFLKAAENGQADAQSDVGQCYLHGQGVPQNEFTAFKWFSKAAVQNHPRGQLNLGRSYRDGRGVGKDHIEAYKWFKLAANNPANEPHKWFRPKINRVTGAELHSTALAAESGRKFAAEELASLSLNISSTEMEEGERRYREFKHRS